MNPLKTIWTRWSSFLRLGVVKQEIDEELRFHLEQRAAENIAAGMSPEEAAREARKRFGNLQSVREECREKRGANLGAELLQDLRFGSRMLRKNSGFTTIAVLTLALGIGANTAIFSIINGVLLRPLQYHDPDRLVTVNESSPKRGFPLITVRPATLRGWQEQNSVFGALGGEIYDSVTLTGLDRPLHLNTAATTLNLFDVFGVPPLLGRTFVDADKPPGRLRVVVLSYGLWQSSFGGDRGVIGRSIALDGRDYTVVGVMPPKFKIFNPTSVFGLPTGDAQPQLWFPFAGSMEDRSGHYFLAFGRLKAGITAAQAQAEMDAVSARLDQGFPTQTDWGARVQPLKEQIVGGTRAALRLLLGAVGFVLLIACANVANLSLARSAAREKEFAVRSALGAARGRLIRQLLVESTILSVLGGGLGVMLARACLAGVTAFQPASFPRLDEVRLDGSVLGFTLLISLLTGLVFGLAPALHSSAPDLNRALKDGAGGSGQGQYRRRARNALVVTEVALAMMLLAGAGLMITSFARLTRVSPGFEPERLLTFDFCPPYNTHYAGEKARMNLVNELRRQVQAQPGVESSATIYGVPFGTMLNSTCVSLIAGRSANTPRDQARAGWRVVSPNYFKTMNVPVLAGRPFSDELDTSNSPPVVIINASFARKYFPGENPLGKRIQVFTVNSNWCEIVGISQDVKLTGLDAPSMPEVYEPASQVAGWMFSLVVRSSLPARQVEDLVKAGVAMVDKGLVPFNIRTMDQAISTSVASQRFTMLLIGLFAALALTLTAVGIYGVVSYSVSQQTREFGIRMALGASHHAVLGLVLRQGMVLALAGLGIGLAGSFALTRLIAAQLFEVSATDPATFVIVAVLLMLVTLTACYLPARRATKTDPMEALRYE